MDAASLLRKLTPPPRSDNLANSRWSPLLNKFDDWAELLRNIVVQYSTGKLLPILVLEGILMALEPIFFSHLDVNKKNTTLYKIKLRCLNAPSFH